MLLLGMLKMIFKKKITNTTFVIIIIFLFAFSFRLWNLNEMGRVWDEPGYIETGYKFVKLLEKKDFANPYWYKEPDHPPLAKYIYGLGAQLDYITDKNGVPIFTYDFNYARLMSVIFSSLAVVLVMLFGWKYISPFVGISAGLIFSLLPIFLGYSQLASLESIRMFFYILTIYLFFAFLESPTRLRTLLTGIAFGLAIGVKQSEILLIPIIFVIYYLWCKNKRLEKEKAWEMFKKISSILLIAFIIFILLWPMPWFHLDYVINFTHNLWYSRLGQIAIPEVFFGRLMLVPKGYYIIYFLITTPFIVLLLFLLGLLSINIKRSWILYSLVLIFITNFFLSFYSLQQHGVRYIIEIYFPLALISAVGLNFVIKKISDSWKIKLLSISIIVIYLILIVIKLSPYYLEYFNVVVGGVNNVYEKRLFQIGWWGQGLGDAGKYIKRIAPNGSNIGLAISPDHVFPKYDNLKYYNWVSDKKYDYVVVNYYNIIREGFDDSMIKQDYNLIYKVQADKAVLVFVYKHK